MTSRYHAFDTWVVVLTSPILECSSFYSVCSSSIDSYFFDLARGLLSVVLLGLSKTRKGESFIKVAGFLSLEGNVFSATVPLRIHFSSSEVASDDVGSLQRGTSSEGRCGYPSLSGKEWFLTVVAGRRMSAAVTVAPSRGLLI